jgi:hypothetical protein
VSEFSFGDGSCNRPPVATGAELASLLAPVMRLSWVDYEWLSPEQQEPAELFGCSYLWAGSTK